MAGEIEFVAPTGLTMYAQVRNSVGQIWNGAAFENYLTANIATYNIAATEQGSASGYYTATMPAAGAGVYNVVGKKKVGGSVAESDPTLSTGQLEWTGSAVAYQADKAGYSLAASGLDAISAANPTGLATTFATKLMQLWQATFKRHKKDATGFTVKVYQDDNVTQATTQSYTVAADGSQDVGAAS